MDPVAFLILLSSLGLTLGVIFIGPRGMRTPASHTQTPKLKLNLSQDFDDFGFIGTHRTRAQLMLPINPYASSVKLALCETPEEQELSKLLIA